MNEAIVPINLPNNLFAGKTAIVTGASRGVGRATALRLAEGGANVVVNYLSNEVEALETVRACQNKGVEAIAVVSEVTLEGLKLPRAIPLEAPSADDGPLRLSQPLNGGRFTPK